MPAAEVSRLVAERRAGRAPAAASRRNAFPGVITKVTLDRVSALVEIQAGPHRVRLPHHARGGRRAPSRTRHGSNRNREGDQRHGGGGQLKKLLVLAMSSATLLAGCGDSSGGGDGSATSSPRRWSSQCRGGVADRSVREIGDEYEEQPRYTVAFSFGPSDGLASQIQEGAPATCSPRRARSGWMRWRRTPASPSGRTSREQVSRHRCRRTTPRDRDGRGSRRTGDQAGPRRRRRARRGLCPRDARERGDRGGGPRERGVERGRRQGGRPEGGPRRSRRRHRLRTDVTASVAEDLEAIDVPDDVNVVAVYPIAGLAGASEHAGGFVEYVLGPGQETLQAAGFLPP